MVAALAAEDKSEILLHLTRLKPSVRRTTEEKMWVALDALLNPTYYDDNVPVAEREEMRYDAVYQAWQNARAEASQPPLTRDEVARILALPRSPASALPFLQNAEQVEMHRLLMKFSLGRGEPFQKHKDACAQDFDDAAEEAAEDAEGDDSDAEVSVK